MLDGLTIPLNVVDNLFDVQFDVEEFHNKVSPFLALSFFVSSLALSFLNSIVISNLVENRTAFGQNVVFWLKNQMSFFFCVRIESLKRTQALVWWREVLWTLKYFFHKFVQEEKCYDLSLHKICWSFKIISNAYFLRGVWNFVWIRRFKIKKLIRWSCF